MLRTWAGIAAATALKILARLPPSRIVALGTPLLPGYILLRPKTSKRLRALRERSPFPIPSPLEYYHMRLRLAALSLRHLSGRTNDHALRVEGEEHYLNALASGKPVALLGWHQGPVELLHRIPPAPEMGRPFFIVTAGAFSESLTRLLRDGRRQSGKTVASPRDIPGAMKAWAKKNGVLAAMVDQVPGGSEESLRLLNGKVRLPFPESLLRFCLRRQACFLTVKVRLEGDETIMFRYLPGPKSKSLPALKTWLEGLVEKSIVESPEQFNWSYPGLVTGDESPETKSAEKKPRHLAAISEPA